MVSRPVAVAAVAVPLFLLAGFVTGCTAPAVTAPATSAPPAADSAEPTANAEPQSEFTDELLAAEGALTVDDTFLVRNRAHLMDECRIWYAADIAGLEQGSEEPIAECWALMDEFDGIAEDFLAKLEPWVVNEVDLSDENETLVNTSYGAMMAWLGTSLPDGCINEPGSASAECEESFTTKKNLIAIWLDSLADQWADDVLAG